MIEQDDTITTNEVEWHGTLNYITINVLIQNKQKKKDLYAAQMCLESVLIPRNVNVIT